MPKVKKAVLSRVGATGFEPATPATPLQSKTAQSSYLLP